MTAPVQEIVEMETANEQTPESSESPISPGDESVSSENAETEEDSANELELPRWSIVTFEGIAMSGLSYEEARKWLEKLNEQNISGLCIVTDESAARISK
jgi:hypothetical protein